MKVLKKPKFDASKIEESLPETKEKIMQKADDKSKPASSEPTNKLTEELSK